MGLTMRHRLERLIAWGFGAACALLLLTGLFAVRQLDNFVRIERQISQGYLALQRIEEALSYLKDAESGQRGFLLTADVSYLDPYHQATQRLYADLGALRAAVADDAKQSARLARFESLASEKLSLLADSIQAASEGRAAEAVALMRQGEGRRIMDELRVLTEAMKAGETELLAQRATRADDARRAVWSVFVATLLSGAMLALLTWSSRARQARQRWRLEDEMRQREAVQAALAESRRTLAASEQHFRAIAESLPQLVWSADSTGRTDYYNSRWYAFTGTAAGGEDDGWLWMRHLHPDDLERAVPIWSRCLATGEPYDVELRMRQASDGAWRWFMVRALPVRDAEDRITRWFGTYTDIDDYRRLTEQLRASEARERASRQLAEEAGRSKDEFVAVLSHELRTPLNAVLGWTQVLQRLPSSDERVREALRIIERNARLQGQLIADLFDLNRLVSGKMRLELRPIDLSEVIGDAVASLSTAARLRGVSLATELDDARLPMPIVGDAARLHQVLWNLLSNAIKFTPTGGQVRIVQNCTATHAELSVIDSGEGIDPQALPRLFERYYQAGGDAAGGGLGLGLSIVRSLVELHGGAVSAHSAGKGTGARFTVRLPLAAVPPEPAAGAGADEPGSPDAAERRAPLRPASESSSAGRLDGVRALVVDDDRDGRELVRHVLEARGARVETVDGGADALACLAAGGFDVLISDIGMPGIDGHALVRQLRAREQGTGRCTPAIALTALARAEDRTRALTAGYQAHLAKPVDVEELVATVASLHGLRRVEAAS